MATFSLILNAVTIIVDVLLILLLIRDWRGE